MRKRTKRIERRAIKNMIRHKRCINGEIDFGSVCTICQRQWLEYRLYNIDRQHRKVQNFVHDSKELKSIKKIANIYQVPVDILVAPIPDSDGGYSNVLIDIAKGLRTVEQQRIIERGRCIALSPHHTSVTEK